MGPVRARVIQCVSPHAYNAIWTGPLLAVAGRHVRALDNTAVAAGALAAPRRGQEAAGVVEGDVGVAVRGALGDVERLYLAAIMCAVEPQLLHCCPALGAPA